MVRQETRLENGLHGIPSERSQQRAHIIHAEGLSATVEGSEVHDAQQPEANTMPEKCARSVTARRRSSSDRVHPPAIRCKRSTQTKPIGSNVRFVVINKPEELKNRDELRLNRQHVMHDYLSKEASKPNSKDVRANGQGSSDHKRKRSSPAANSITESLTSGGDTSGTDQAVLDQDAVSSGGQHSLSAKVMSNSPPKRRTKVSRDDEGSKSRTTSDENGPLVPGMSGRFRNYAYLGTSPEEVPFPLHTINGSLNPFETWPTFSSPSVHVNELKWSCSRRFGSRGIGDYWVPMLLKARHSFLSTIAISSAHDDIMRRAIKRPEDRPKLESVERAQVRQEVTSMINESMGDPEMRTSDATLVAVLHLLNAEIMGCDDGVMRVHQHGLSAMVQQRGGLNLLGVNGQLAAIIATTMYIIATLRESTPGKCFVRYVQRQDTSIADDTKALPESPLCCRPSGYRTITRSLAPYSFMYRLLGLCRQLTDAFTDYQTCSGATLGPSSLTAQPQHDPPSILQNLHSDIFAFPAASALDFNTLNDRFTYEAIRLTSHIYAHALLYHIPFSLAASELQATGDYRSLAPGFLSTEARYIDNCALHIHLRNAIMRTDISDCWGHMAGVLFWIGLVGGAAANPARWPGGYSEVREGEEEDARKWLAAVVVRCSILLGFEFGKAVMGTVKRVQGIQQELTRNRSGSPPESAQGVDGGQLDSAIWLPVEPLVDPSPGRSFADYAWDFLDA